MLGRMRLPMMVVVVNCPPIQSIVVVTSSIGDQAPPALAAMTTMPAKSQRVRRSSMSLRNSDTMTMDVVKLSSRAEKKNVKTHTIHSIHLVPRLNAVGDDPESLVGIDKLHNGHGSHQEEEDAADFFHVVQQAMFKEHGQTPVTVPHAFGRKQMVFSAKCAGTSCHPSTNNAQHTAPVTSAEAALSMWMLCSRAMKAYPRMKTARIRMSMFAVCAQDGTHCSLLHDANVKASRGHIKKFKARRTTWL